MISINEYLFSKKPDLDKIGKFYTDKAISSAKNIADQLQGAIVRDFDTGGISLGTKGFIMNNPTQALKKLGYDCSWKRMRVLYTYKQNIESFNPNVFENGAILINYTTQAQFDNYGPLAHEISQTVREILKKHKEYTRFRQSGFPILLYTDVRDDHSAGNGELFMFNYSDDEFAPIEDVIKISNPRKLIQSLLQYI